MRHLQQFNLACFDFLCSVVKIRIPQWPVILCTMFQQPSKLTSALSNCWGFCRGKQCFCNNHLGKNIASGIIPSKIYIQFTIFNTYFSTLLSFTNKRYNLHVLEKSLCLLPEVRFITHFSQFIHRLSLRSRGNGKALLSRRILSYQRNYCQPQRRIRLVTLSKSYLHKFLF